MIPSSSVTSAACRNVFSDCGPQTGGSQYDYETLRKEYDAKANAEVRELQKAARQERIQKLIAQADLNPDWIFDKMDSGDPALQYPIETARYFISGFEHWEKSGGAACRSTAITVPANPPWRAPWPTS